LTVVSCVSLPTISFAAQKTYVGLNVDFTIRCANADGTSSGSFTINGTKSGTNLTLVVFATAFNTDVTSLSLESTPTAGTIYNSTTDFYPKVARAYYAYGFAQGILGGQDVLVLPNTLYSSGCS
jgi:hypothetical protein